MFRQIAVYSAVLTPLLLPFASSGQTASTQPSAKETALEAKVQSLEAKVDKLEAAQGPTPADIASVVQSVLADADAHSQFANGELGSGYDPNVGFVIRSNNGQFSLHPSVTVDIRNMTSYRVHNSLTSGSEVPRKGNDLQNGFDLTRVRFLFDGNFTKDITYFIQFAADQGNPLTLFDAYFTYHFDNSPFAFKVGQFKDPVWHERNLSEATLLAVDRSLLETLLGGVQTSRIQGAALLYDQDRVRNQLVVHDGFNSINTKFFDSGGLAGGVGGGAGVTPTNYGITDRAEYMVIGDRSRDFNPYTEYDHQFTALGDQQDILVLGAAADYSQAGSNDVIFHTFDAQYDNTNGLSLFGAYMASYRKIHVNQGVAPGKYYDPGFLLQAAYLVTDKIEPFVRYDYTYLDHGSVSGLRTNEVQEITAGANYYLHKHNAKFTIDGVWLPNGSPADADALGILKDSGHNEFLLRAQFQLSL